jgi:hypothetical protein
VDPDLPDPDSDLPDPDSDLPDPDSDPQHCLVCVLPAENLQ